MSGNNKTNLIEFIVHEWLQQKTCDRLDGKQLFVTCGSKCYMLTKEESKEVSDLESTHEEADTRMIFHAAHASRTGNTSVVIVSEDTDVFLLTVAFNTDISAAIYQKCGKNTHTRYVDVSKVATTQGPDVCKGLLGILAFTGCDTISAFAGKGKVGALKLLQKSATTQEIIACILLVSGFII